MPTVCKGTAVACVPVVWRVRSPCMSMGCMVCGPVACRRARPSAALRCRRPCFAARELDVFERGCRARHLNTAKLAAADAKKAGGMAEGQGDLY